MERYITPNDPQVKQTLHDILTGWWRGGYSDFDAIKQWVATHITYESDPSVHGQKEYWQLPSETLSLGTGDCEDFAILLCTLYRAYGIPADEVYVGGGFPIDPKESGHAFLFEHWSTCQWRATEPQEAATWDWVGITMLDISAYSRFQSFNDQYCIEGKPTPPAGVYEFEVGYSYWPMSRGASVSIQRYITTRESVAGKIEWCGTSQIVYDWSLNVYDSTGTVINSWSGRDLSHNFNFTALTPGTYKIEVLKRDYFSRVVRITVKPTD